MLVWICFICLIKWWVNDFYSNTSWGLWIIVWICLLFFFFFSSFNWPVWEVFIAEIDLGLQIQLLCFGSHNKDVGFDGFIFYIEAPNQNAQVHFLFFWRNVVFLIVICQPKIMMHADIIAPRMRSRTRSLIYCRFNTFIYFSLTKHDSIKFPSNFPAIFVLMIQCKSIHISYLYKEHIKWRISQTSLD